MGENCGQGIGFHLIFNQWIKLIRFEKRVPNWKVRVWGWGCGLVHGGGPFIETFGVGLTFM